MDIQDTLKGLLGDGAEDKIKTALDALASGGGEGNENTSVPSSLPQDAAALGYITKIKGVLEELNTPPDDNRARLLMALRPYMRSGRQQGIDSALRMLNLTRLGGLIGK